jgi:thiosulfate/3-mercaptopyruvate sulfurtransferase
MINTFYSLDMLGAPMAGFLSLVIGFGFGFALERAGFSSSRRLAGVFYFTDMAVVKVMFSALITALLGLSYMIGFGWIQLDQIFLMPSIYGAQIAGGLLFGVGFVMGAWCPGTAVAGLAAGRIDAFVFLLGVVGGSILFNEIYPIIHPLYIAGNQGVQFVYDIIGVPRNVFILAFTLAAVAAFWFSEWAEKARTGQSSYLGSPFLKAFSLALVALAGGLFMLPPAAKEASANFADTANAAEINEKVLMQNVEHALDHIEPEELADRLMAGEPDLLVVDVRPATEFNVFHIRGAINVPLPMLAEALQPYKNKGLIVLYSNGMTHPAQARDSLQRQGFGNVYMLTDGLKGFRDRCLKPVSLRAEPLTPLNTARVNAWHAFFTAPAISPKAGVPSSSLNSSMPPDLYTGKKSEEARGGHIPGALNQPFTENIITSSSNVVTLKPTDVLATEYARIIPSKNTEVIVHCRTGHQASQTYFVLKHLLGYPNVKWYDGGWTEWSARTELPIANEATGANNKK